MPLTISIIVAASENNCIGRHGDLPWHIPEDLKHFKDKTTGHTVIMGRRTWDSIVKRLGDGGLPNRKNIVLSRGKLSLVDALNGLDGEVFIIGGAQIYELALPIADKIYLTRVHQTVDGDAFFPELDENSWKESARETHNDFSFIELKRFING